MRVPRSVTAPGPTRRVRAFKEHALRRNDHAQRTLTCTNQVLYLKRYTDVRIRSNVLRIRFVSELLRRVSVERTTISVYVSDYLILSLKPHHKCPGFKVGVRMHTPRPVGMQVNKVGVKVNNLGVNNLGVTTTRSESSAISYTLTSSTNTARSS